MTGIFDAFGLLRKSYRNTVEISEYANEILRHGDFSIYPVEPIIRHGNPVQTVACPDENKLLADTVTTIKKWQQDGYETIAVICRDEAEAAQVAEELKKYVKIVETDLEKPSSGMASWCFLSPTRKDLNLMLCCCLIRRRKIPVG